LSVPLGELLVMPKCMLCGEEHRVITNTHLKYYHNGVTQSEYQKMFPGCELFPVEVRRTLGPEFGSTKSEYTKRLMAENHAGGVKLGYTYSGNRIVINRISEETRKAIREGNLKYWSDPKNRAAASSRSVGRVHTEGELVKMSRAATGRVVTEETRKNLSKALTGRIFTFEHRSNLSEAALKLWNDPIYAEKQQTLMHQGMKALPWNPSLPEILLGVLLEENFSDTWIYNGTGGLVLGRYIPDFIRKDGEKQLIEVFGEYWHPEEDEVKRKEHYRGYGYSCLVIWESDIWVDKPKVINLVGSFIKGGG
jgi:hypothetical protein